MFEKVSYRVFEKSFIFDANSSDFCCKNIFFIQEFTKTPIDTISNIEIVIQTINSTRENAFILFLVSICLLYI